MPLIVLAPENPHRLPALVHAGTCGRRCGPALGQELSCGGVTQATPIGNKLPPYMRLRKRCELCWVLRNEFDYCSASRPRIGCFSPAASRLRRLSQQYSFSSEHRPSTRKSMLPALKALRFLP